MRGISGGNRLSTGECAKPKRNRVSVPVNNLHLIGTHPQLCRHQLRDHRLGSLSLGGSSGRCNNGSGWSDPNRPALKGPAAGCLNIVRHANPDTSALLKRLSLPRGEIDPPCRLQCTPLTLRIVAAVIRHCRAIALQDWDGIRHFFRRNKITPAYFVPPYSYTFGDTIK